MDIRMKLYAFWKLSPTSLDRLYEGNNQGNFWNVLEQDLK